MTSIYNLFSTTPRTHYFNDAPDVIDEDLRDDADVFSLN